MPTRFASRLGLIGDVHAEPGFLEAALHYLERNELEVYTFQGSGLHQEASLVLPLQS